MRILLITDNHAPTGGAERYFFELKKRLKTLDDVEVTSLGFGPHQTNGDDFIVMKGVKSKLAKWIWQLLPHPGVYFKLRRHIKKIQPDIIHLHNIKQYTVSLLYAVKPYPVVQTIHDYGVICPSSQNLHRDLQPCPTGIRASCFWQHRLNHHPLAYFALTLTFLRKRRLLKKIVNAFIAPSPLLAQALVNSQFHHVTAISPFKNAPCAASFSTIKPYHFFFAGSLSVHKGIHVLLEEFALAYQQNNQLTLTLAGSGPEENRLRLRIQQLGLENAIHLIGWQEDLEHEYAQSAAVIFPSLCFETFGLVMTEAMNHSRPVIGSNRGTPPWVVDHLQTGLIFDPLKKGDLAEKILMLAGNMDLITQLGTQGEIKLRTFIDNDEMLQKIVSEYRNIN